MVKENYQKLSSRIVFDSEVREQIDWTEEFEDEKAEVLVGGNGARSQTEDSRWESALW